MVTKLNKKTSKASHAVLKGSVKDSAQQIWQAGLGALTRAQTEGTKAVEALVKESVSIQRKTAAAAEGKLSEATSKMTHMATDISSKASGQWDKLENIFEERVAKALNKLGVPSAKDVSALISRIDELNKAVQRMSLKTPAPKAAAPKTATSKAVPKSNGAVPSAKVKAKVVAKAAPAKAKPAASKPTKAAKATKAPVASDKPAAQAVVEATQAQA